ncbi:MAG: hypothetical protein EAX95_06185 [Candidatus Thorarchaeota archaeon]|nr:hypothetical protein [Candidatus Thorarchaeota archaeon]
MNIGEISIEPIAAESMGVRSLCTMIRTPDVTLLMDPSAALSMRYRLEPHPKEYRKLLNVLQKIFVSARTADILSISHYHFDHVRPGFTDFRYTLSSREELQRICEGKVILAKDYRDRINASQRRRGFYFEKDVKDLANQIHWSDGSSYSFGNTTVTYSPALPHGPTDTSLGFVVAAFIEYDDIGVLFAPDVQGPVAQASLDYIVSLAPNAAIIGGPPIYLDKFSRPHGAESLRSLHTLTSKIPLLVVDHHLMRSPSWKTWIASVLDSAQSFGHRVLSMAELAGVENECLEANRPELYKQYPPDEAFMRWTEATDEYKVGNLPPL